MPPFEHFQRRNRVDPTERVLIDNCYSPLRRFAAAELSTKAVVEICTDRFRPAAAHEVVGLLAHRQVNELMLE